jgi:hypothetical protein
VAWVWSVRACRRVWVGCASRALDGMPEGASFSRAAMSRRVHAVTTLGKAVAGLWWEPAWRGAPKGGAFGLSWGRTCARLWLTKPVMAVAQR